MSPQAFIGNSQPDPTDRDRFHHDACNCAPCSTYREQHPKPGVNWRGLIVGLSIMLITILMVLALLWIAFSPNTARAQEGAIHPVPAPTALTKERGQCQTTSNVETCLRSRLRRSYEAIEWQRHARLHQGAYGVQHALRLAAALYGVPLSELRGVGMCESHLTPTSKNRTSTAAGVFQFLDSTWRRAGIPGFSVYDPYANILAAARLVKTDGSWREWSCQP